MNRFNLCKSSQIWNFNYWLLSMALPFTDGIIPFLLAFVDSPVTASKSNKRRIPIKCHSFINSLTLLHKSKSFIHYAKSDYVQFDSNCSDHNTKKKFIYAIDHSWIDRSVHTLIFHWQRNVRFNYSVGCKFCNRKIQNEFIIDGGHLNFRFISTNTAERWQSSNQEKTSTITSAFTD